jgi:hypothetical protein
MTIPTIPAHSSAEYQAFFEVCITYLPLRVAELLIAVGSAGRRAWHVPHKYGNMGK